MTPQELTPLLQSLPPILYIKYQGPILAYSKAPWGLSVLLRVTGIFTGTTISPGGQLRQCPDRYTIRAGRNLPDKEFRYLRTVIVTAAVYWGFNSGLAPLLLTFQHRAGVTPYTSPYGFAESCVFAKQSLGPIHCGFPLRKHPFSRSYGVILPSSLTRVLSSALGYSPHPPVLVCGTVHIRLAAELFLAAWNQPLVLRLASALSVLIERLTQSAHSLSLTSNSEPVYPSASLLAYVCRYGNVNPFPIGYAFLPRLRGRLTLGRLP